MTRMTTWLVACAVAVGCQAGGHQLPEPPRGQPAGEVKLSADEQAVLDATNAERKAAGLGQLTADPKLLAAARGHAANMAKQDKLEHTLDGAGMADRVKAAGYEYRAVAENIARVAGDADLRLALGANGRARAASEFDADAMAARLRTVLFDGAAA